MLAPRSPLDEDGDGYALGCWVRAGSGQVTLVGGDAGVSFWSRHDPLNGTTATVIGNTGRRTRPLIETFGTDPLPGVREYAGGEMPRPATPEDAMRGFLSGEDPNTARFRRFMARILRPALQALRGAVRGPGGAVLRHLGSRASPGSAICGLCIKSLNKIGVYPGRDPGELAVRRHPWFDGHVSA